MTEIVQKLKEELGSLKFHAVNYRKWIKECRASGNKYGVESYSEDLRELATLIPQYKEVLKILINYKP